MLFNQKQMCCGCEACVNTCSKQAILMKPDNYGFLYPSIDERLCINCGMCKKICAFQNIIEENEPRACYAACNTNETQLMVSSSGGIFSAIASEYLENGGVVFGAALEKENNNGGITKLIPKHIAIHELKDLVKLQGSKYVQSNIGDVYKETKKFLSEGRQVLFSGTPCQIAGLKAFLQKKHENLFTVDIICHGVPNAGFFMEYLSLLENKFGGKIVDFKFRDKNNGWESMIGEAVLKMKRGVIEKRKIYVDESSYYKLFLNGTLLRESCYACKYASKNRPADITVGDYWGIQKEHPEILSDEKGPYSVEKGISCIIVNTEAGMKWIKNNSSRLYLIDSSIEKITNKNVNLYRPSKRPKIREKIMDIYSREGYAGIDNYFHKNMGIKICLTMIKNRMPRSMKILIKKYFVSKQLKQFFEKGI